MFTPSQYARIKGLKYSFYESALKGEIDAIGFEQELFREKKKYVAPLIYSEENKKKIKGSELGFALTHELKHRQQHQELSTEEWKLAQENRKKLNEKFEEEQRKLIERKATKKEKAEYITRRYEETVIEDPLELQAVQEEYKPRQRDIYIPEKQRAEAFRQTFQGKGHDDNDGDGIINAEDCDPNDPNKQGRFHNDDIYHQLTDEEYRRGVLKDPKNIQTYGEVKEMSGKKVGAGIITAGMAVPVIIPNFISTPAGLGVMKYVDKVRLIKTDEHDKKYRVPRVEVIRR